jgi:Spy/CpxP family protein refolding chaperone
LVWYNPRAGTGPLIRRVRGPRKSERKEKDECAMNMKKFPFAGLLLVVSLLAAGQMPAGAPPKSAVNPRPPFAMGMDGFHAPELLLHEWWKDPLFINELHLTDAQQKQLADANLEQRLALIDAGAAGLKSLVRLRSLLDASQLDEGAYNQQLTTLSDACAKAIHDIGALFLTTRRVLTPEQWRKLETMRREPRMFPMARPQAAPPHEAPAPNAPPRRP